MPSISSKASTKDLIITRYNKAAWHIFALNDDSIGEALTSIATEIDIPNLRKNVLSVIKNEKTFTRQLECDGISYLERILPYRDDNAEADGAVLTYHNNTGEQEILHKLRESEERYDLAVQGSNAGIWDWNIRTGDMHWSELFKNMLGIRRKNFKPSIEAFEARIHDEDRDDVMTILQAHLQRGFEFNVEFRMRKDDNNYVWIHARGQAIWDETKTPTRMTGSVYDITDRRQALEYLSTSNDSLQRFAYVCSHDLKEPTRLIENFVDLFKSTYGDDLDETGSKYLSCIEDSASRMQEMIKGILT
jgi:PAS domain S-box-containing protein